jgi:NADPH2 dehydrogenase
MKMTDPIPQFSYILNSLASAHPSLSYVHLVEPRAQGGGTDIPDSERSPDESLDFARKIWARTGRPFLAAGGFTPENALAHMAGKGKENDAVVFGRWFIANVGLRWPMLLTYSIDILPG